MKRYEKPTIEFYTLSGNETICGGCDIKLVDEANATLANQVDWLAGDGNGTLTKEEANNAFGTTESCFVKIDNYCKFTGTAQNVSWS